MVGYLRVSLCLVFILASSAVSASDFSVGGAVAVGDFGYRKASAKILPVPLVNYEYGDFYLHTLNTGYYLLRDDVNDVALTAGLGALSFNPSDSDDVRMKKLDKRKNAVMAGILINNRFHWGAFRTSVGQDVSGNSRGIVADTAYLYPVRTGKLTVTPGVGVSWSNGKFNQYYYGVSSDEARRSGLAQYAPGDSLAFYMELSAFYQVNRNWYLTSSIKVTELNGAVAESDIIAGGISTQLMAGFGYRF